MLHSSSMKQVLVSSDEIVKSVKIQDRVVEKGESQDGQESQKPSCQESQKSKSSPDRRHSQKFKKKHKSVAHSLASLTRLHLEVLIGAKNFNQNLK